jgi:flagellin
MSLIIQTNKNAGNIFCSMYQAQNLLLKSMQKLSSGLRINSAADDPAGLVISEQMRARIASLNQEIENTQNMINKYETASSSALQMRGMLTEMRSLAVAASNSAINDPAIQGAYQDSIDSLVATYNNIAENSTYGSQRLFDGSEGSITTIAQLADIDVSDTEKAGEAMAYLDDMASRLDSAITNMGATQKNELEAGLRNLQVESQNLTAAESQIRDADYAIEFSNFLKGKLLLNSSVALLAHSYITPQSVLSLVVGGMSLTK